MTEISITENKGIFTASCPYCGKIFSYPHINQTRNNVESHAKYCKYKPRNEQTPTVRTNQELPPPPPATPSIDTELFKKYEQFYTKYHTMIEQLQQNKVLP